MVRIFLLIALLCVGTTFSDVMQGQAEPMPMRVEETFTVQDFHYVQVDVPGDVLITQADREALTIEGQKEEINRVSVGVINDTLYIKPSEAMTVSHETSDIYRPLVFEVAVRHLHGLKINKGTVQMDGLRSEDFTINFGPGASAYLSVFVDNLTVNLQGDANLQLRGVAKHQVISASGSSSYNALDLLTDDAEVQLSDRARVSVNVKDKLYGYIRNNAYLYYLGILRKFRVKVANQAEAVSSGGTTTGGGSEAPGHLRPKAGSVPPNGGIAPPGNTPHEQRPPQDNLNHYL